MIYRAGCACNITAGLNVFENSWLLCSAHIYKMKSIQINSNQMTMRCHPVSSTSCYHAGMLPCLTTVSSVCVYVHSSSSTSYEKFLQIVSTLFSGFSFFYYFCTNKI